MGAMCRLRTQRLRARLHRPLRQTISGVNAECMHSKSHVLALFGKPGMKSVGSTGCVSLARRLSSWKHSPDAAPFGPLVLVSEALSSFCRQRSGNGL